MTETDARLVLGESFDFIDNALGHYSVEVLAEGTEFGNPVPIEVAVRAGLLDGSVVVHEGDDNREIPLRAVITAPDAGALKVGATELRRELYRRNTLTYTPPRFGDAAVVVYDVITSSMARIYNDLAEVQQGERHYALRLICEPFGRSPEETLLAPTPTVVGTSRQQMYAFQVAGAPRTQVAFTVAHATASLGHALVYTFIDDGSNYSPPLRQYAAAATAAAATADATMVSGARNLLDTAAEFDVPSDTLPTGSYDVVARLRSSAVGDTVPIGWGVRTLIGANVVAGADDFNLSLEPQRTAQVGPGTSIVTLGTLELPQTTVGDQASAVTQVVLQDLDVGAPTIDVDEVWLINTSIGALTLVDCGTGAAAAGGPSRRLVREPATTSRPRARLLRGHATDDSDAFYPDSGISAADRHVLTPPDMGALVVTTNASAAAFTLRYYERHSD